MKRKALDELRKDLWDALCEEHEELAHDAMDAYDRFAGFLSAAIIDAGGELCVGQEAWNEYATRKGNLRLHTAHDEETGIFRLSLTDRDDRPLQEE